MEKSVNSAEKYIEKSGKQDKNNMEKLEKQHSFYMEKSVNNAKKDMEKSEKILLSN